MKIRKRHNLSVLLVLSGFILYSCHGNGTRIEGEEMESEAVSDTIRITTEQFLSSGMEIGTPVLRDFRQIVMANGYIKASPEGMAQVSALIPGRVRQINHSTGDPVQKGDKLFTLEGSEIILLQQEYAEAINELTALKSDYDRQKVLADQQITSRKDLINTESSYLTLLARTDGLKARLRMINIEPASVEQGRITPLAVITSPIKGLVSKMELVTGQYIEPGEMVMEIIDPESFRLNLHLFEKGIRDLASGQKVIFYDPDDKTRTFDATLSHIGRSIDPETKTILCLARLSPADRDNFVNNLYVQAEIITCERQAPAIPTDALIREDDRYYALRGGPVDDDSYLFHRIPIEVGVITEAYIEVLDTALNNILLKGAYNLSGMN